MSQTQQSTPPAAPLPPLGAANDDLGVLVVNQSADILDEVAALLRRRGLPVEVADCPAEARRLLDRTPGIGVLVADVSLLQGEGMDLAAQLLGGRRAVELVMLSGWEGGECGHVLDRLGLLREPLTPRQIEQAVHQALGRAVMRRNPSLWPAG